MWGILVMAVAFGSPGPPVGSLEDLTEQADGACLATISAIEALPNEQFRATLTQLETLAGECPSGSKLTYLGGDPPKFGFGGGPRRFHPKAGETYLLFVEMASDGLALYPSQLLTSADSGLFRVNVEAAGASVPERVWSSLSLDLISGDTPAVNAALAWLDGLSLQRSWGPKPDFGRQKSTALAVALLGSDDPSVRNATVDFLGSGSGIYRSDNLVYWLEGLNPGTFPGIGAADVNARNWAATEHFDDIVAYARHVPPEQRAKTLRVLFGSGRSTPPAALIEWLDDSDARVRAAAVLLQSDLQSGRIPILEQAATDPDPKVRGAVAQAIVLAQDPRGVPLLEALLADKAVEVQMEAARALLGLGTALAPQALERQISHPIYGGLFVNALAVDAPGKWTTQLTQQVFKQYQPSPWWGGFIPYAHSWKLLFAHVSSLSPNGLRSHETESMFSALEHSSFHGSSEPRDLYQLYRTHGLDDRADAFRAYCAEKVTMDLTLYFDRVDGKAP